MNFQPESEWVGWGGKERKALALLSTLHPRPVRGERSAESSVLCLCRVFSPLRHSIRLWRCSTFSPIVLIARSRSLWGGSKARSSDSLSQIHFTFSVSIQRRSEQDVSCPPQLFSPWPKALQTVSPFFHSLSFFSFAHFSDVNCFLASLFSALLSVLL